MKITPEMVREAEAHFPFALAEGPTKGPRWQWFADFYNHALENPGAPCPCCNVTPDGDIMDHLPEPPAAAQATAWTTEGAADAAKKWKGKGVGHVAGDKPPSATAGAEEASTGCGSFGPVFEHLANAYGVSSEARDGAAMHCHAKAIEALRGAVGFVQTEVRNALRELDCVTAADDQADAIGCAENALNRALAALASQQGGREPETNPCT